jgi:2-oxo-4-hydroxy-4-carboxy-5-ureidoimidazoline decarboxylase
MRQDHFPILAHGDVRAGEARVGGVTDSGQVPVAELNEATVATAAGLLRPACASTRWIERMISGRPYRCVEALTAASDGVLATVGWPDIEHALAAHPRIGARLPDPGAAQDQGARPDGDAPQHREAAWSRQEQSGTRDAGPDVQAGLRAGNAAYEERFGHVFLICATGMSAASMLAALQARLGHDPATEREVVRDELTKIVRLRLAKTFE